MEHTLILNIFIGTIMPILFKIRLMEYKVIVDNTTFFNNRLIDFISSPINYINLCIIYEISFLSSNALSNVIESK